ncbi:MAG: ABC transporter ATP-binding protein [Pseudomonadota bacterium]|nr:ABC transporter ATP-binding protein [Pseudomonadota bacterium]
MNDKAILEARDIQVRRGGRPILDVASLDIAAGEVLSVIGPNGAGKTTLLQALSSLLRLDRGEIRFQGARIGADMAPLDYRRQLAMVFQEALLFDTTVAANVAAGLRLRGADSGEAKRIVAAKLEQLGIGALHDRSAKTLSGGEAQRTSLARAFAIGPQILFLDEPFAALDPPTRESLIEDLGRILRESGATAVMATHDQGEALRLSDRIAVMHEGRIVQIGSPTEVMNHPVCEFVAAFVGVETILAGRVVKCGRGTVTVALDPNGGKGASSAAVGNPMSSSPSPGTEAPAGGVPGHAAAALPPAVAGGETTAFPPAILLEAAGEVGEGERVLCCIRPEHVTVAPGLRHPRTSARNIFPAAIDRIIPLGPFYKVCLDGDLPLSAYVTVQSLEELALRPGLTVTASFKAASVHLIRRG